MHTYSHPDIHASLCACVETCVHYYIVTFPGSNIYVRYVEAIYKMLKPGGIWINLGPLLYHWVADMGSPSRSKMPLSTFFIHTLSQYSMHSKIVELRRVEADNNGLRLRVSAGGVEGVQVHLLRTIHDVDHV